MLVWVIICRELNIWSIKSTLISVMGDGENVRLESPLERLKEISKNMSGFERIDVSDFNVFYRAEDNRLEIVYGYSFAFYNKQRHSKSEIIITPAIKIE